MSHKPLWDSHPVNTSNPHSVTAAQVGAVAKAASSTDNAIMRFDGVGGGTAQNSGVTIDDDGNITIATAAKISNGDTAPDCVAGGMTLKSGSYNGGLITLKSGDQAHGMTDLVETDTYAALGTVGSGGGLLIRGFTESDDYGLYVIGYGATEDNTLGASGLAPVLISGRVKSGATSTGVADGSNLVCFMNAASTCAIVRGNGDVYCGDVRGMTDNTYTLGSTNFRWNTVYATNTTINASDKACKKEITDEQLGLSFIKKLKPKGYKWADKERDEIKHGLMAQDVADIIDPADFAGVVHEYYTDEKTGEQKEFWGLRYSEFIGPLIKAVQEQQAQIDTQQATIDSLTDRLEKLEKMIMPKDNGVK